MTGPIKFRSAPIGVREIRRRQCRLRGLIGEQLRDLRFERGASQAAVGEFAGVDQAHVSRIERGVTTSSLDTIVAMAAVLGADVSVRLFPTAGPRIRDHIQAAMIEALVRQLDRRWGVTPELPVPIARGVIDLALRDADAGIAIACEAHSQLRSIDLVLRRLHEKTLALESLEGPGRRTSGLLLVRSTDRNRQLARLHGATLTAAFPGRCLDAYAALTGAVREWSAATLLWVHFEHGRAEVLEKPPRGVSVGR